MGKRAVGDVEVAEVGRELVARVERGGRCGDAQQQRVGEQHMGWLWTAALAAALLQKFARNNKYTARGN